MTLAKVTVKFFASVREAVGEKKVEVEAGTVRELLDVLSQRFGNNFSDTVLDSKTKMLKRFYSCMINGKRTELLNGYDTKLNDGDVIAIFPPVGGG